MIYLFGKYEKIYVNKIQLLNLAKNLYVKLSIMNEFQIEKKNFSEQFIKDNQGFTAILLFKKTLIDRS